MTLIALVASARLVLAVSPLVTDDADTVEQGHLQLNGGWQYSRTASVNSHTIPVNPVFGLSPRGELGATFGYQWRDGFGTAPEEADGDGITDLTLETKWKLWQSADAYKVSARLDVKIPTASERRGFGTGHADMSAFLIGTRCGPRTCLDANLGYTAIDASQSVFGDNRWFLGQAVRHQLSERWTLIGETYALVRHGRNGTAANGHFSGGAQFAVHENVLLWALLGSSAGADSPDLTAYLGFTWELETGGRGRMSSDGR